MLCRNLSQNKTKLQWPQHCSFSHHLQCTPRKQVLFFSYASVKLRQKGQKFKKKPQSFKSSNLIQGSTTHWFWSDTYMVQEQNQLKKIGFFSGKRLNVSTQF